MQSIHSMYQTINRRSASTSELSYTPHRQYLDVAKIKYERDKKANHYLKDKPTKQPNPKVTKGTFLEQIQRRQRCQPSPQSYCPQDQSPKYKQRPFSNLPSRVTIFQESAINHKKNPTPGPSDFSPKLKSKSTGTFDKAPNADFLDELISKHSRLPGIGEYSAHRQQYDKKMGKWDLAKRPLNAEVNQQTPSACTYSPRKLDRRLFCEMAMMKKKNSILNKQKRWADKENSGKMFYAGLSEWGMKTKYQKKDLLARLSTHTTYAKSVYH